MLTVKKTLTAIALLAAAPANAATVVSWVSVGTPGALVASEQGTAVTQFSLNRSAGLLPAAASSSTYNSKDWQIGGTKLDALVNNEAIFWGFNATQGYDLTSLSFGYDRSPTGPVEIAVDFFINGFFQGQIFADTNVAVNSTASATIDLSAYDNVTNGFFRLAGWGATSSAGTFDIENRSAFGGSGIVITGELTPVPLPASMAMLLVGIGALGVARRRA